jgi:KAP family P-loop domain
MQEIRRLFAGTLRRARTPVGFLVDDLDRCNVDYAVEFLEVIQTLVRGAPRIVPDPRSGRGTESDRVCCIDGRGIAWARSGRVQLIRPTRRPAPLRSAFAGFRFPPEVIVMAVRWCLRFGLSYRDVEELLAERAIEVDHGRVHR